MPGEMTRAALILRAARFFLANPYRTIVNFFSLGDP